MTSSVHDRVALEVKDVETLTGDHSGLRIIRSYMCLQRPLVTRKLTFPSLSSEAGAFGGPAGSSNRLKFMFGHQKCYRFTEPQGLTSVVPPAVWMV